MVRTDSSAVMRLSSYRPMDTEYMAEVKEELPHPKVLWWPLPKYPPSPSGTGSTSSRTSMERLGNTCWLSSRISFRNVS